MFLQRFALTELPIQNYILTYDLFTLCSLSISPSLPPPPPPSLSLPLPLSLSLFLSLSLSLSHSVLQFRYMEECVDRINQEILWKQVTTPTLMRSPCCNHISFCISFSLKKQLRLIPAVLVQPAQLPPSKKQASLTTTFNQPHNLQTHSIQSIIISFVECHMYNYSL